MASAHDATECATAVRARFDLSGTPRTSDLLRMVQLLGASISNVPGGALQAALGPVDGCFDGSWQVSIDRSMASHRFRFALAHELAHLYLRHHGFETNSEERWCNEFAAELLMPKTRIAAEYGDAERSLATVRDVARRYDVSQSAALVRLRHVLGWERGLIGFRLRSQEWSVARMTGIPSVALYQLEPRAQEADIPRGSTIFQSWLPFGFHHEQIEVLSECLRRGRWVDVLVNSTDLERVCTQILRGAQ